jgi:hypothetical protein
MVKLDKCKYKVIHIPTNTTTWHSNHLDARRRAIGIDGLIMIRQSPELRHEFLAEYRYGRKK